MHAIGEMLGKTIGEIEDMPRSELVDWVAYVLERDRKAEKRRKRR